MPRFASTCASFHIGGGLVLLALGCGEDTADTREYQDVGAFCLRAADGSGAASLLVRFGDAGNPCLSSCDDNVGSCHATVVGGQIVLESTLEVTRGEATDCDAACATVTATCALVAPAGDYVFVLQGRNTTAAVPPLREFPLFGERACEPQSP